MVNSKRLIALAACVCLMWMSGVAGADESWKKVEKKGEMTVGFCAQYPPFESKNEKTAEDVRGGQG